MRIRILGCFGSETPGKYLSSYLVNDRLLLDAGAATAALTIEEQIGVDAVVITHSHLDHIKDLAFLADNVIERRDKPIEVYGTEAALSVIKNHLMNDQLWPDFSRIPTPDKPVLHYNFIGIEKDFEVLGLKIHTVETNHTVVNTGLFITEGESTFLYTSDTGPTERIWEVANNTPSLKGLITEISFPNNMQGLAEISGHLTPEMCKKELAKINNKDLPVYIVHLKAGFIDKLKTEIEELELPNLHVVRQGEVIEV